MLIFLLREFVLQSKNNKPLLDFLNSLCASLPNESAPVACSHKLNSAKLKKAKVSIGV
jgi:hypothetical protein